MNATDWSDVDMGELLPTGTVTLLLADVEGSTQLWETQPAAMTAAVSLLDRTVTNVVAAHGGVRPVEQGEGDSFVAAFARASDAVACALDLQRTDLAPIKLRIGVHTGEVQLRDEGNYAGPTINKTARLRDLAHGGQTVLSGATEGVVEDRLPHDAWLIDLGSHALRDLPRAARVAQLCHPDLRNDFPPLRTANTVTAQHLPVQLTTFIGRSSQIIEIQAVLADNRLVTLTGAGGAGKTRLAIEVAGQMTTRFPTGVWYADLAPITHPEMVPLAVARALGLPDLPGRSITDALLRLVRDRHMLLVLDNCEHLLEACAALVNDILAAGSTVTILTTSREPLVVAGEVVWQVPSLSLTDEAVELFSDRARHARPEFAVTDGNGATVAEICRRLDGMPLAIELAAARVRTLSLDEIMDSLHDRFRLLTGGARTAVRRQQTLRASVDWSHALLTEPERTLLRRLAVFMGGFDLDAAQAVAAETDVQRYQTLDQLSLLVDKSLVIAENTTGRTRYRMLETVRQYALEKLGESGEADDVRARHRDHYTALAARLDAPRRDEYEHLIEQVEVEIDNLRSAFTWSLEANNTANAIELACSLQSLWLSRGRVLEGLAWLAATAPDNDRAEPQMPPALQAKAIADIAVLSSWIDVTGKLGQAEQALAIARTADDPALLTRVLTACACVTAHDPEMTQPYSTEAIELARSLGDSWRLSVLLGRRAVGAMLAGDAVACVTAAEEGVVLADAVGDHFNARQCRWVLSWAHLCRGDTMTAVSQFGDLAREADAAHDVMSKTTGLINLAYAQAFSGDPESAQATANAVLESCAELGGILQDGYFALVMAQLAKGDAAAALQASDTALQNHANAAVDKHNLMWAADAALASGDTDRARRWANDAVAGTAGIFRCLALAARARVSIAGGDREQAATDAYEALAIAASMAAALGVPDLLESLAELALDTTNFPHAVRLLGAAHAMRQHFSLARFKIHDESHQNLIEGLRNILGDSEFDTAWADGAALCFQEALAYALRGRGQRKRPTSGWGSLTPTELDVVRLVGKGLHNKDIAARLFVSPRTVQSHLRHAYNKLGLTSRVQLAQEVARRN